MDGEIIFEIGDEMVIYKVCGHCFRPRLESSTVHRTEMLNELKVE
jgi:hypothetical protein